MQHLEVVAQIVRGPPGRVKAEEEAEARLGATTTPGTQKVAHFVPNELS